MIKPSIRIQARRKLIFLYLLRSSSALATSEPPLAPKSTSLSSSSQNRSGHIALRLATRTDVPAIQRCNLATLPENYSSQFYVNHLRQWPDLALVAEHVVCPDGATDGDDINGSQHQRRNPFENYNPSTPQNQNEIIGYVLGKVEETAILDKSKIDDPNSDSFYSFHPGNTGSSKRKRTEMMGHVTSLAVLPTFRRKGLAAKLMKQLHFHMQEGHDADGVGLHVRVSNVAARRLYCEGMGYGVVDVIRGYYQDGEDAFFMRKNFVKTETHSLEDVDGTDTNGKSLSRFSISRMRRGAGLGRYNSDVFENGPLEFRLPQIIPLVDNEEGKEQQQQAIMDVSSSNSLVDGSSADSSSAQQVMSGSL